METSERHHAIKQRLEHLRTLRDEILLNLHLAGMEARTRWEDLEPMARDAELLSGAAHQLALEQLDAVIVRLRTFRDDLHSGTRPTRHAPP